MFVNGLHAIIATILLINVCTGKPAVITKHEERFKYYQATSDDDLLHQDRDFWNDFGTKQLEKILKISQKPLEKTAKNVVIFIGDGMGIATITAARIYKGQREFNKSGEDHALAFEDFPNVALAKTYNVDMQVPDSAGTATAILTGVKTRYESIGLDVKSNKRLFDKEAYEKGKLESVMTWAQRENKDTGIITTTRITHATPAASYAHVNHREWECDSKVPQEARGFVKDIARQLVEDAPGKNFKVILGGGYQQFGYITDDQSGENECTRSDNRNLTKLWLDQHSDKKSIFVTNNGDLEDLPEDTEYLLGLFHADHVPYEILRDKSATPSLTQMVAKGLPILQKNPNGFVLLIEGGRIDHGHHKNYARLALEEASEFDRAISWVLSQTNPSETLVIVTADHSHSMTLNGYSKRGNDILGYGLLKRNAMKPSLTLTYANGPGFLYHYSNTENSVLGPWIDTRNDSQRLLNPKYQHLAAFAVDDESHGGEDVAIYATGPGSNLVRGVVEQNYIAHFVSYVACIGPRKGLNPDCPKSRSGGRRMEINQNLLIFVFYLFVSW